MAKRKHGRAGFTILELMIVVSIIGLLSVLAIPAFMKQRRQTQDTAFLNNLRLLAASMERHAITEGDYPADATAWCRRRGGMGIRGQAAVNSDQ